MRSIVKMLGLAFVAALALGAFGAGSASALLFLALLAKQLFTVEENTKSELETLTQHKIECQSTLADGLILNKTDLAHSILFTLHKCTTTLLFNSSECTSSGQPKGLIKTFFLRGLLITLPHSVHGTGKPGILLEPESGAKLAEFECTANALESVKVVFKGGLIGEDERTAAEAEAGSENSNFIFAKKGTEAGMQEQTEYETLKGTGSQHLISEIGGSLNETVEADEVGSWHLKTPHIIKICHN